MDPKPLPRNDLREVLTLAEESFRTLRGARIFVTGGTRFFGHWLLEALLLADRELDLGVRATVLTRDAARFRAQSPWIAENAAITLLEGDVRSFAFPAERHTHILHAATDSGGLEIASPAHELTESIVAGTQRVLEFALATGATHLLYTSSGAVYGRSTTLLHTPESCLERAPAGSYEAAKREAEDLCLTAASPALAAVIARCFAFVGPRLPLDRHFAIGNFIGAAISGQPIHILGDGTPRRSWLYMSDLAVWLWTMLACGEPGRAYNVGSDDGMSIAAAARLTAATLAPGIPVQIDGTPDPAAPVNSYVPSIDRARDELGLEVTVPLTKALLRTAAWYR
jgi:dTDP-glucose 4,6-dehydratase